MAVLGDFLGMTGVTRGGRRVKKLKNRGDVIYGWFLSNSIFQNKDNSGILVFTSYLKYLSHIFVKALSLVRILRKYFLTNNNLQFLDLPIWKVSYFYPSILFPLVRKSVVAFFSFFESVHIPEMLGSSYVDG